MNPRKYSFLAIPFFFTLCFCTPSNNDQTDLILINGKVWMDSNDSSFAEAIAITGSTITQVGTTTQIKKFARRNTEVVDLKGKLVIPGFNDAHIHFLSGSLGLSEIDLSGAHTIEEMMSCISTYASENPNKSWLTGRGWQYTQFSGGLPTKNILDSLLNDRPVYISAYDGHSAWVNTKALNLAGINRQTSFSGYGEIVRDVNGNATGALKEEAMDLVSKLIPDPTREEKLNAIRKGIKLAASLGITSFQNAKGSPDEFSLYEELLRNEELTVRVSMAFSVGPNTSEDEIKSFTQTKNRVGKNGMLRASAVKFMLDGVIEAHTGAMIDPYSDISDNKTKGDLSMPLEHYQKMADNFDKLGFQIYTHAIGDRAVREALNTYELIKRKNGTVDARHRIEHIEMISSDDFHRFPEIGVLASMQPIHAEPGTSGVWSKAVGEKRLPNAFAWASMLKNNASLVFSSDWPACASINPIRGLHTAVTRRTTEGYPEDGWVVAQKITMQQALRAYTQGGAYASFDEHVKGKIEPGYLADIVILSKDLFAIDPMEIHKTRVLMTIFDGKIIYEEHGPSD